MSKLLQIGITGGIGTGKSFVCNIFRHLGIPIYDADSRAKWLMNHDRDLRKAIIEAFGEEAYNDKGLNRTYVANKVFNESDNIAQLNATVHPAVGKDYLQWTKEQKDAAYVIKEAALMFESGAYKQLDKIIYVHADEALRINRIKQRDPQRTEEEIRAIIRKQLAPDELSQRADYIIYNDEKQMLLPQILQLHQQFSNQKLPG